ncbi:MAG: hypothetical protein WDN69_06375 [Aliidongia sp.]
MRRKASASTPRAGHVFVADSGNDRIQLFDAKSFAYVATLGTAGTAGTDNAHFNAPSSVFVNGATGQLYVADTGNQRVQIFETATLAYVATLGSTGAPGSDNLHSSADGCRVQPDDASDPGGRQWQ